MHIFLIMLSTGPLDSLPLCFESIVMQIHNNFAQNSKVRIRHSFLTNTLSVKDALAESFSSDRQDPRRIS